MGGKPNVGREAQRPEFIPLEYDNNGKVTDILGYVRKVEAIPYGLFHIAISHDNAESVFHMTLEILDHVRDELPDEFTELLKKDLEGKVGFISEKNDAIDWDEGTHLAVQLYRVKD